MAIQVRAVQLAVGLAVRLGGGGSLLRLGLRSLRRPLRSARSGCIGAGAWGSFFVARRGSLFRENDMPDTQPTPGDFDPRQLAVCSVVKAELFFGSLRSQNPTKSRQMQDDFLKELISLPFDDAAAEHYAQIRANLTSTGELIGPNDLIIAAIALTHNLTLVTHNTAEFSRVKTLQLEDWELPI